MRQLTRLLKPGSKLTPERITIGILALALLGGGIAVLSQQQSKGTDPYREQVLVPSSPDPNRALNSPNADLASVQTEARVRQETVAVELLNIEASRLRAESEKQLTQTKVSGYQNPCYRGDVNCPLDRLEIEAIEGVKLALEDRNWQRANAALFRLDAVRLARSGNFTRPEIQRGLLDRVLRSQFTAEQQNRLASQEAQAKQGGSDSWK
jgi:hypothetical protein